MVVGWIFGGDGCHATSKAVELSYKIGYLITTALFLPDCPVCPVCTDCQVLSVPIPKVYMQGLHYDLPSL